MEHIAAGDAAEADGDARHARAQRNMAREVLSSTSASALAMVGPCCNGAHGRQRKHPALLFDRK